MKITKKQLRKIIQEVVDTQERQLMSPSAAYEAGRTAGFNNFEIAPEMTEANGGLSHPFYKDYMDGFDTGIDERTGRYQ